MKVKIASHMNTSLIGKTCDVVYYDFCTESREIVFKCYDGGILELKSSQVRVIVEDEGELEELESYVFKKVYETCLRRKDD